MKYTFIKEFKENFIIEEEPIYGLDNKFFYVYKILFENGEYYIGKHRTKNLNDGYCGSGILIQQKIANGEIKTAKKIILEFHKNDKELSIAEERIIGQKYITDSLCLNKVKGGEGGWDEYVIRKSAHLRKGMKRSQESIEKQRLSCTGKRHTMETKEKMSLLKKEYFKTSNGEKHKEKIRENRRKIGCSEETKKILSKKAKERWDKIRDTYWTEERKRENRKHMLKIRKLANNEESKNKLSKSLKEYYKTHKHPNAGKELSEETKLKISKANKGKIKTPEHCKKISESKKGKKLNEETKRKFSEQRKGRGNSRYISNKIEMYDLQMNLVKIFNDCIEAVEFIIDNINNKASTSEIFVACRTGKTRYKHKWKMIE